VQRDTQRNAPRSDRPQQQQQQRPPREARADSWTDAPKPERGQKSKPPEQAKQQTAKPVQQHGDRVGFADSMPAFMRKPPRPLKQPGRG
jgi:hypothetical protein